MARNKIDDDDLISEFFEQVSLFPPKTNAYEKYFNLVLNTVQANQHTPRVRKDKPVRTERLPEWFQHEEPSPENGNSMVLRELQKHLDEKYKAYEEFDIEEERKKLEKELKEFRENK